MKDSTIRTRVFGPVWLILSGIIALVLLGLLDHPGNTAMSYYYFAWLGVSNLLWTIAINSSRLALMSLIVGWLGASIYFFPGVGLGNDPGSSVVFGVLFLTSILGINCNFVHIASYGGVCRHINEQKVDTNAWDSARNDSSSLQSTDESKKRSDTLPPDHRILTNDIYRFDNEPRWQRRFDTW